MTDETKGNVMTLEQVRDNLLQLANDLRQLANDSIIEDDGVFNVYADAIDAHLSRQVSDEDVERACAKYWGAFWPTTQREADRKKMRSAIEAYRAGRGVVVSSSLHARLNEIVEWEGTGVLCDGELRKAARQHAEKFSMPVSSTLDMAKHEAWREAAALLLAQCKYVMPAGWKLVPVEPTDEMLKSTVGKWTPDTIWKAMLAAAPQPGAEGNGNG